MSDDTIQRQKDAAENKKSYEAIMASCVEFGVPFSLGLTMFFTNLVMANGLLVAVIAGLVTHFFVAFVGKTFFQH